jgi:putative tryptophan/tyrosine transport system substrate-binding protein
MRRRQFITLLGGAMALPIAARAQQPALPVIGILSIGSSGDNSFVVEAFRQGLKETGYVDGQNVTSEYRYAEGQDKRLPTLASELVHRQVNAIVTGGNAAALAVKAATATIPIVFTIGGSPVELGLVKSLNRPAGNITGATLLNTELDPKRLGLIAELTPDAMTVAFLVNPDNPTTAHKIEGMEGAANGLRRKLQVLNARNEVELDDAFAIVAQRGIRVLVITSDIFFARQGQKIAALTSRYAVPVISAYRDAPASGGFMSYGASIPDSYRQVGVYTGRILKGVKPSDLPVVQPTKFDLVINLKTAKALGLSLPPGVLAIADEVIE